MKHDTRVLSVLSLKTPSLQPYLVILTLCWKEVFDLRGDKEAIVI